MADGKMPRTTSPTAESAETEAMEGAGAKLGGLFGIGCMYMT
jgi:hypothetical protein